MPAPRIRVGPFDLIEPLARGGMGEVWRGVHATQGVPVAIKVLTAEGLDNPLLLDALRNEVRAVAGLDHPHVVWVYDQGQIGPVAAHRSQGKLVEGTPWLAMEFAQQGTLAAHHKELDWSSLRTVLLQLLDALAHAHARGVLHRDIKPANVLLGGARPGWKLTDFGMVYAVEHHADRTTSTALSGGTPAYMAPEQFLNRFEAQGPWTDLYALGCMAWALTCHRRPFPGKTAEAVGDAHLSSGIPALVPAFPVPDGFEEWVRALMAKRPEDRLRRAADAAWGLLSLPDTVGSRRFARPMWTPPAPAQLTTLVAPVPAQASMDEVLAAAQRAPGPSRSHERAPFPSAWARPERTRPAVELTGAGIGLYGLRTIPLVDREPVRDALWSALGEVVDSGKAGLVLLHGPAGCGKSRLAEWLSVRSHEVGAATVYRALHNPITSPNDGLAGMLGRALRCFGQTRHQVGVRLREVLVASGAYDPGEVAALLELLRPAAEGAAGAFRFESMAERHEVVGRALEREAGERPVVCWLDDVQWGADALRFATRVMRRRDRRPLPVLFVLTARDEALAERPTEKKATQELASLEGAQSISVGPLAAEHRVALVQELLGLEPRLAAQVAERTAGNPLFAVQLVGDWVERGVLRVGASGFELDEGAAIELPDGIHDVWSQRVEALVHEHGDAWRLPLELAAVLGQEVELSEWTEVCASAGQDAPRALVAALEDQRLARIDHDRGGQGWSFVHGMLRESLERFAIDGGRWAEHHAACARMLEGRSEPGTAARLGWHRLCAGQAEAAIEPLHEGARPLILTGDYGGATRLMDARRDALEQAGVPPRDKRWGRGWIDRSLLVREQGHLDEAMAWVDRSVAAAREHDWPSIEVIALTYRAELLAEQFDAEQAWAVGEEAVRLGRERGQDRNVACALHAQGLIARRSGKRDLAHKLLTEAVAFYEASGESHRACIALQSIAMIVIDSGDGAAAEVAIEGFRERAEAEGYRALVANADNLFGEVARYRGDFDVAERCYRAALQVYESIDHQFQVMARINLGFLLIEQGDIDAARPVLEQGLRDALKAFHTYCASIGMLSVCASEPQAGGWDRHMADVVRLGKGRVDGDFARMARIAGDRASAAGHRERAAAAYAIAVDQYQRLGRDDAADEVRGLLDP